MARGPRRDGAKRPDRRRHFERFPAADSVLGRTLSATTATLPPSTADLLDALRRGDLVGARELRLPGGLAEFPREIFGLADTLELLDVSGGTLDRLPADMGRLHKLRVLFCSGNRFECLPPALGDCAALSQLACRGAGLRELPGEALPPALRWLTLTDNRIAALPLALGERPVLQKLLLAGNRLSALPANLAGASSLELVRLAANRFESLPPWLAELPRLAWLGWAGNPFEPAMASTRTQLVPWQDIELRDLLGEGASGRVHRVLWRASDEERPREVALKLFKGAMTSDGLPDREIAACVAAGDHPALMGGIGRLVAHPEGMEGLVTPLLPAHWRPLAGLPSLASCSRDVYDPALRIEPLAAMRIARAVAAAAAHLHARDLLHGDLYGHNTLWDGETGEAVLGDFGAASVLPGGRLGLALKRVETRAWGLLLGELLVCCADMPKDWAALRALEAACVATEPGRRPLMAEVVEALDGIIANT